MKTLHQLQIGVLVLAMLILNTISCTKENPPAPASNTSAGLALDELNRKTGNKPKPPHFPKLSASYGLVTTFAGGGINETNGVGSAASFIDIGFIVIDHEGNLYVTEGFGNRIRKITTPGAVVSTFAGDGTSQATGAKGLVDGTGTAARFNSPLGLAVGPDDNIYVADNSNSVIRKVTHTAIVSTYAGVGGLGGFNDGPANQALFDGPLELVVCGNGTIYVTEFDNQIRKITSDGMVTLFAGNRNVPAGFVNGTSTAAIFNLPGGLALDKCGNLYVADAQNNLIRKITPKAVVTTFAGNGIKGSADGPALSANFNIPVALVFDSKGNLYVAEAQGTKIRKITPEGLVSTLAGSDFKGRSDGIGPAASFISPSGLAIDKADTLYVADSDLIRKIVTN
jgi:sugar lactone lactonase YvrE